MRNNIFIILIFLTVIVSCKKHKEALPEKSKINSTTSQIDSLPPIQETTKQKPEFQKHITHDEIKGLYLSAYTVASANFDSILILAEEAGINTIIFDLKNMNGHVFYNSLKLSHFRDKKLKPIINIPEVVKALHSRNMKAVSRVVMFHDQIIAVNDTTLCPQNKNGNVWREGKKPSWIDSSHPKNQKELLSLIDEIASQGVDEIQLDYVRFPTNGKLSQASFYFNRIDSLKTQKDSLYVPRNKYDIIASFVKEAQKICRKHNVTLSADVFAIVSWQNRQDVNNTGQKLSYITKYLDYIHPMIYPSHFAKNFNYRQNVWNEPYDMLFKGTTLTIINSDKNCKIVPYIQAFDWQSNYTKDYLLNEIQAIRDAKGNGFILWNAQNNYKKTLQWLKKRR